MSDDMIFALATDERTLLVFASAREAVAHCEGIDVEDGMWRFWDRRGDPLQARFSQPNRRGSVSVANGAYSLESRPGGQHLMAALRDIGWIGDNTFFDSLTAVGTYLATATRGV